MNAEDVTEWNTDEDQHAGKPLPTGAAEWTVETIMGMSNQSICDAHNAAIAAATARELHSYDVAKQCRDELAAALADVDAHVTRCRDFEGALDAAIAEAQRPLVELLHKCRRHLGHTKFLKHEIDAAVKEGEEVKHHQTIQCPNCGEQWTLEDVSSPTDRAKWWSIKDPSNKVYSFMDLMDFVRNHRHLFLETDLIVSKSHRGGEVCNAYFGLSTLRPGKRGTKPSWKGWTWNFMPTE